MSLELDPLRVWVKTCLGENLMCNVPACFNDLAASVAILRTWPRPMTRPALSIGTLLNPRSRDFGFLKLHGSARLAVLDSHHGQVSALVANLCRRIDYLANGADGIDN